MVNRYLYCGANPIGISDATGSNPESTQHMLESAMVHAGAVVSFGTLLMVEIPVPQGKLVGTIVVVVGSVGYLIIYVVWVTAPIINNLPPSYTNAIGGGYSHMMF